MNFFIMVSLFLSAALGVFRGIDLALLTDAETGLCIVGSVWLRYGAYFAYTEPEKATFLEEIGDKKYTIQRSKGLGENDPEMMWLTTMNPESRRLIKVMPTDVERTAQVFDILLGDNLAGRKEHIAQHGAEYLDDLDVS